MAFYHTGFGHTCANTQQKHTRMTKCNFIILSPFKYWHACLTLQLGQQQVPAQLLWPNQSCNKVSASAFPSSLFLLHCQRHRHIFSDMFCLFYFYSFYFYAKITWLFPTSIRNGSKISFEFCWSLHTVDLWFSVNAWWLPLSGTLFIQHGWPLQHLLRRNSTVVAGSTAEFGQRTFFIPAKRNLKESEEEKVNLQRWALSLQIPVTLSNPPWPSNFWNLKTTVSESWQWNAARFWGSRGCRWYWVIVLRTNDMETVSDPLADIIDDPVWGCY